ncbi:MULTISPECIES: ABC transporter ATP-binding protein [Micromonospora]|uniref:ABC transporter permease n=1 Tax=Micromonospora gifhornensis TaxID=84594 RepID=A0ABQ4IBB3_9ACTN|nr:MULTISPECIES: ABC transporter ATP-binding protein [Micromonospora]GIJ15205.1 ABC transporter permease [Micromonospora gifhornensis]
MSATFAGSWRMLATAWRMHRGKTVTAIFFVVAGASAAPLLALVLGSMTDAVVAGNTRVVLLAGLLAGVLAFATVTFGHFAHLAYVELAEQAELDFDEQLITLSNGSVGIAHHEHAATSDTVTVLQREIRQFGRGLEALLNGLGLAIAVGITVVLLVRMHPLLLLLPLAAVPSLYLSRRAEYLVDKAKTDTAETTRTALHLFNLTTQLPSASELRVFGLADELRRRHAGHWSDVTARLFRADLRAVVLRTAGQVTFALAYVGSVLLLVRAAVDGRRGVGDVILVVVLAAQINQQVTATVTLLRDLQRMAALYGRMAQLRAAVRDADPGDLPAPDRLRHGIALQDVSFSYPGTGRTVLRDVTVTLPAGSTVAVVGENGAGKSTLVKLLCGLYRPSGGRILLDHEDLHRLRPDGWRERISVAFQDAVRYEFRTRHAVGIGDLDSGFADQPVRDALRLARADDVLRQLPDGLDTVLGKGGSGAELSGGQWQKVALARALARPAPLLLVLDEPTTAMDPEAELAMFEHYAEQASRVSQETGAITLLVSHRFSTVRTADLIIVVRDGRVVETGDHATLSAGSGPYAELVAINAWAYR